MRTAATLTILLTVLPVAVGQDPLVTVQPRYGIAINTRNFPQGTAKQALEATIRAIEESRFDVLVAHLIDTKVTEAKADENARLLENDVEKDLQRVREQQKANPLNVSAEDRLPYEPTAFAKFVKAEAKARGFKATIEDVKKKFAGDTSIVPELKQFLREGEFAATNEGAKVTIKGVKGKAVYFVKAGNRFFIEDRKEEPAPAPKR